MRECIISRDLDEPAKFAPHLEVRLGNAHTEEASKYKDIGGSARNTILILVRRTHPLIVGNSLSNQESHKQPYIPRRVYGGLVNLAHLDPYYVRGYLWNQHKRGSTPETKFLTLFLVL